MQNPAPRRRVVWIVLCGCLIGALYAYVRHGTPALGALVGGSMGATFFALERFALRRNTGAMLGRMPFLPYLALRSALYAAIILFFDGAATWFASPQGQFAGIDRADILVSLVICVGGNLLFGVNDLLGPGVLFAFVAGRYHQPRIEERVALFIDMRSSTAIAERLGELRFTALLNRFIVDVSLAIVEAGGEIHKYVGDEVIATWKLAPGANGADSVRACFLALARLDASATAYERDFGLRADFWAALHCGPVVVTELGYIKKEIALIGDTMNTAARIEHACRGADCRILASAALLERIAALPAGVTRRSLGLLPMRGKEQPLDLYALEASNGREASDIAP